MSIPVLRFSSSPGLYLALLLILLFALARPIAAQEMGFALPDLKGQTIRLADFRGQWVIVNFWATWCTPCLLEMPELQAFHQAHHDRTVVIGVNFEELVASEVQPFADRLGITFPVVLSGGQPVPHFEIKGLPTTFLISPTGQLADTHLGTVNAAMLAERLAELERTNGAAR